MKQEVRKVSESEETGLTVTINNANEHRRLLLDSMVAVVEGRMNVAQANAVAALSTEVHKSIRQEFDMLVYAAENFTIGPANQLLPKEDVPSRLAAA